MPDKEMKLVLYCARISPKNLQAEELKEYIKDKIDWQIIADTAIKHGLINILYLSLKTDCEKLIPKTVLNQLKTHYFQSSSRNLFLGAGLIKVLNLFNRNNIAAIPFKGPIQSWLIYHDIGVRTFADLDILVKKKDALTARNLLIDQGFRTSVTIPESQINYYLKKENFFQLKNKTGTINIDLHWEISGRYNLEPMYFPASEKSFQHTMMLGKEIKTLNNEDTLIHLCIHGTSHCWEKLEMICSVAKIIESNKIGDWDNVLQKAKSLRCKRMVLLGLVLARYFFNTDLPMTVKTAIADNIGLKKLSNYIIGKIENSDMAFAESLSWRFSPIHFRVRDSLLDGIKYFFYLLFQPTIREWDKYPLPNSLLFFYHVLRPYRLIKEGLG
ncbi:MAG: nucleotidyltransferase family protein, partial [Desulfobacula sp.]|nr:nucleotidyltransferase family protein [Desulfobacula sp.]